jgi:hypothetical protein
MADTTTTTAPPAAAPPAPQLTPDQQKVAKALSNTPEGKAAAKALPDGVDKISVMPKIHKTIFTTPPGELIEKGEFKIDDGSPEDLQPEGETRQTPEADGTTKAGDKKVETAKPEATTKPPETTPPPAEKKKTTDVVVDTKGTKGFDYTGFQPEEVTMLKQMSNPAREFTAKALRDFAKLRSEQPAAYYQHPEAYRLTPEFVSRATDYEYATREQQFWRQQLIQIRAGKPWNGISGWDEKGNALLTGPFKPNDEAEIDVSNVLQNVTNQAGNIQGELRGLQQNFAKRIQTGAAILQAERAKRFEWVNKPELLEETIPLPDVGDTKLKAIRDDFKQLFDTVHHNNPLMELCQDMFVALQVYGARIRALEGENQHEKTIREDVTRMEPSPETAAARGDGSKNLQSRIVGMNPALYKVARCRKVTVYTIV